MTEVDKIVSHNIPVKMSVDESVVSEGKNSNISESNNTFQNIPEICINNIAFEEENVENNNDSENIENLEHKIQKKCFTLTDSNSEEKLQVAITSKMTNQDSSEITTVHDSSSFDKIIEVLESNNDNVNRASSKTNRKRLILIDSDSEDELLNENTTSKVNKNRDEVFGIEDTLNDDQLQGKVNKSNKIRLILMDSDSEVEENDNSVLQPSASNGNDEEKEMFVSYENQTQKKKSRLFHVYDSDSDSEEEVKTVSSLENNKSVITMTFETDEDIEQKRTNRRLKTLCDSESSAEETEEPSDHISTENIIKQKRIKKTLEPIPKKMTGKEAFEQRREIKSESQRMARESRVHLPYHRPKQHTLQEFLKRRSLLNNTIKAPPNTPTGLTIKMLNKNIKTAEIKLKQREKEIEEFYKSESEPEDEPELEPPKNQITINSIEETKDNSETQIENSKEKINETEELKEMRIVNQEAQQKVISEDNQQTASKEKQLNISELQQDKTTKDILQDITCEQIQKEDKLLEEQVEEKQQKNEEIQREDTSEEQKPEENMEVSGEKQAINTKNIDYSEIKEAEGNEEEAGTELNESCDEDKEAKLKELRQILEKNLTNCKPSISSTENEDEPMESEPAEPEIIEESAELQIIIEMSQTVKEKQEKKMKLVEIEEKLKKLNPIIALKGNLYPKLSGGPNELIVLDDGIEKSKNITNLMAKFLKHTAKKTVNKKNEVSILNVDGGIINKETITLAEDVEDEQAKKIQIPGIRMKKLRLELENQILNKRLEERKKRQEEERLNNEEDDVYAGEKEDCGFLTNKILDNEDEEELTDSSSESEEDEEEDDIEIKEKPRVKSAFVDEEAEDSDAEEDEEFVEDKDDNDEDEEEQNVEEDESEDPEDEDINKDLTKKPLRRIIKPTEDSDEEIAINPESFCDQLKINTSTEFVNSQNSQKSTAWDDNDEDIPAYQPRLEGLEKTPCKIFSQNKNDVTAFLTPTLYLTALEGMNSASKSLHNSPTINFSLPPEPSPLKSHACIKTKLFTDQESVDDNNLDELEELCSGKFISVVENKINKMNANFSTQENELLDICSGNFSSLTQNVPTKTSRSLGLDLLSNEDSQNFTLSIESDTGSLNNELKNIDDSQPLKLSFDKEKSNQETIKLDKRTSASMFPKMVIASSSEDENNENETQKKKKKLQKKKRKYIIDDISITDEDELDEDRLEDDIVTEEENEPSRKVDYDSEENEIEIMENDEEIGDIEKPVRKASDFFDAEAELSESEWGSEDEDERNLDNYEAEEADAEKINENKVQRQLERMHMRNILDEDQREVKLLQELLLDDGELHGSGRERKFRWKNADSLSWNTDTDKPKEEEDECEELESELQWRKMRHEREMFLKEQQTKQKQTEEEIMNDSQIMKLGQKALKTYSTGSQNLSQKKTPIAEELSKTDDIKLPFSLAIKRGSFLQRSETTLARIAEITKISSNLGRPKNSKNFVFTSVEKTEIVEEELNIKKRKAEEATPKALKKLRIADMSPNVQNRKKTNIQVLKF